MMTARCPRIRGHRNLWTAAQQAVQRRPQLSTHTDIRCESTAINDSDHRQVIAELDTLLERIDTLSQRFETLGQTESQRADYLALHDLQARALQQREAHRQALDNPEAGDELPPPAGSTH